MDAKELVFGVAMLEDEEYPVAVILHKKFHEDRKTSEWDDGSSQYYAGVREFIQDKLNMLEEMDSVFSMSWENGDPGINTKDELKAHLEGKGLTFVEDIASDGDLN